MLESNGAVVNPCLTSKMTDSLLALEGRFGSERGEDHPEGHQQQKAGSQSPFLNPDPLATTLSGSKWQRLTSACRDSSMPQVTSSMTMSDNFQEAGVDISLFSFTVCFSSHMSVV